MAKPLIILDAGHAENVAGKRSPDGTLLEWEFNNDMQYRIKPRLEQLGFQVYLTNPSPAGKGEIGLAKRAQLANAYWESKGKPDSLFVSLHANAYGTWTTANGVEVFHTKGSSAKSKQCAKIVCDNIHATLKQLRPGSVNRGVKQENFTVIYKAVMPSILIEYAFYTNRQDLVVLKNNRAELAEATVKALCECFNKPYSKPSSGGQQPSVPPSTPSQQVKDSAFQPIQSQPVQSTFLVKIIYDGSEGLNIRQGPSMKTAIKGQVYKGQVFTIVEMQNGFGKLKSGAGWISLGSKFVKKL